MQQKRKGDGFSIQEYLKMQDIHGIAPYIKLSDAARVIEVSGIFEIVEALSPHAFNIRKSVAIVEAIRRLRLCDIEVYAGLVVYHARVSRIDFSRFCSENGLHFIREDQSPPGRWMRVRSGNPIIDPLFPPAPWLKGREGEP